MTKRQAFAGAICDLLPFFPMLYILVGLAFLPKPPSTTGGQPNSGFDVLSRLRAAFS